MSLETTLSDIITCLREERLQNGQAVSKASSCPSSVNWGRTFSTPHSSGPSTKLAKSALIAANGSRVRQDLENAFHSGVLFLVLMNNQSLK